MADKRDESPVPNLSITKSDLADLLATVIKASQAPSADQLAEATADKLRIENRKKLMQKLVSTERASKLKRQANCRHTKPDGEQTIGGQPFSDGMYRGICLRCQKILVEEPTPELQVAKAEIQRMIESGRVKVRRDGTMEFYENRVGETVQQ